MRTSATTRLALWLAALTATVLALWFLGHSAIASPALVHPSTWPAWASSRDPVTVAMAMMRVAALAVASYLWLVTFLNFAAAMTSSSLVETLALTLTVPAVRRILGGVAGLGLSATVTLLPVAASLPYASGPAGPAGSAETATVATMREVPPGTVGTMREVPPNDDPGAHTASEHEVPPPTSPSSSDAASTTTTMTTATTTTTATPAPPAIPPVSAPASPPISTPAAPTASVQPLEWIVEPGDNFWFKAASELTHALGRAPSDAEIVPYWHTLIEANRAMLADPVNPDLIFPGQHFTVPPIPR